jgi:hypothetical protein
MSEPPDIRKMGAKLRLQTCTLLKLNPNQLTPGDEVLVARVGALKLLVSDLEAAQLRGEKIDLSAYVEASKELESAVRVDHQMLELSTPEGQARLDAEIKQKFLEVIGASRGDDPDAAPSETEQLRQRVAELEEENMRLRWGDLPLSETKQAASEPAQTPAQSSENVVPFALPVEQQKYHSTRTADGRPPPHYLREGQPREPWCDNSGGALMAPYFPLDPYR